MPVPSYLKSSNLYVPGWSYLSAYYRYNLQLSREIPISTLYESRFVASTRGRHPRIIEAYIDAYSKKDAQATMLDDHVWSTITSLAFFVGFGTLAISVPWLSSTRQIEQLVIISLAFVLVTVFCMVTLV